MPHHQVWKQKGEEYRLFGGGGWVWTSGLQLRKRKRPSNEKDSFVNKKRKLLVTTNKIVALKEAKRKEAVKKEAEKAAKLAAQRALPLTTPVSQTVQTTTTTIPTTAPAVTNQTAAASTSSTLAPSATTQMVQTTATTNTTSPAAQTPATIQTVATSTSTTLARSVTTQIVQTTAATAIAATTPAAQTSGTIQTTAASTLVQSATSQTTATTNTTAPAAQTPATIQTVATSTSTSLAQSTTPQIVQTTATAITAPAAQPPVKIQTVATSTSTTFAQSATPQIVQTTATATTAPAAQLPVTMQTVAASTSTTLAQSATPKIVQTTATTIAATAPAAQTSGTTETVATSTSTTLAQSATPKIVQTTATTIAATAPAAQTSGTPETVATSTSSTLAQSATPKIVQTAATAIVATTPAAQTSAIIHAASTCSSLTSQQSAISQMVQITTTSNTTATPEQTSATIQTASTCSSSTSAQSTLPMIQTTVTTNATTAPAVTIQTAASSTPATLAHSSVQNVVFTQTTAPSSTSITSCSSPSVTTTGVSTMTIASSTLCNDVSQTVSPSTTFLHSSVNPSPAASVTTDQQVSSVISSDVHVAVPTSSHTPLSRAVLSGPSPQVELSATSSLPHTISSSLQTTVSSPTLLSTSPSSILPTEVSSATVPQLEVQISSNTASLVTVSNSADAFSSLAQVTSTSSSSVSNTDHSASKCSALPSPMDSVSTEPTVATSSVSMTKDPSLLPDSSQTLVPSNCSSLATDSIENCDNLLQVEHKPNTVTVVAGDTIGDQAKHSGSADLSKVDVFQALTIPLEIFSDAGEVPVSSSLPCQKQENQASTCSSVPSPLTVANMKPPSEVCSSTVASQSESSVEPNSTEATVTQDSSFCDPGLYSNVPLPAEATLVNDHVQKNAVDLGSSLCSEQVTSVQDDLPDDTKVENSLSVSDSQPLTKESTIVSSKYNSDTITCEKVHELSHKLDSAEQGPEKEKSSLLENQPITITEDELSEDQEAPKNLSDAPMTNHDQENVGHTKENEVQSILTSSDVDVLENSAVQHHLKVSFDTRDGQIEEIEKECQSLTDTSLGNNQVNTPDERCSTSMTVCSVSEALPVSQEEHTVVMSKEIVDSSDGQMEEIEKEFQSLENKSVGCSSIKVVLSDGEVLPINQTSDSMDNKNITTENDAKEDKGEDELLIQPGKEDHFGQTSLLEDNSLGSDEKVIDSVVKEDVSVAANDSATIEESGDCNEPKRIEQLTACSLDSVCNHDDVALLGDVKSIDSTSNDGITCSETAKATEIASSPPKGDSPCEDEQSSAMMREDNNVSETRLEDAHKADAVNESSNGAKTSEMTIRLPSESKVSQSVDIMDVSNSDEAPSSCTPATADPDINHSPSEEPMDVDVTTVSPTQSPPAATLPLTGVHDQAEQSMEVDVITVSPTQSPSAATTPLTSTVLNADSCSQVSTPIEETSTSVASTTEAVPGKEEAGTKSFPDVATSHTCSTAVSNSAVGIATTNTANALLTGDNPQVSSGLPSSAATAVPTTLPASLTSQQSLALASDPVKSAVTTISQSPLSTASTVVATVTVKTTASLVMQPMVSVVPSTTALASPRVVATASQRVAIGASPVVTLPQTIPAKGAVWSGSSAVLTTAVPRGIAPQKIVIAARPQGQTTQYVPIGPKPILPSPRPPVLSAGVPGSNVVRVNTQPAVQSNVAPVNSIAALVASIPTSGATIGASQLIRLVTPDGRSITLQGSQLAALAQQAASPMGLAVPKTITLQVSSAATQQNTATTVQKTVGIKTPGATITVQRPQQQVAQAKPQVVIKPKVTTKPLKEEKFPSLEPLIKDPRLLLNRRLAKWPLRHSVKSVFKLQRHELRKLGRKAGMKEVSGYTYASRAIGVQWPAGIPRPSFKVAWRFRTQSLKTLAGAGLQLRILQSCLKWEEMNVRPPRGNSNTVYTSSGEYYCFVRLR